MAERTLARRYAQAIFQIAQEQGRLDGWAADLATIAQALQQPELRAVLESSRAPLAVKRQIVEQVFGDQLDPLARNFLLVLVQRGRLHLLEAIQQAYGELVDEARGIARARVTTAVPLTAEEQQAVAERLAAITGKQIRLETAVDPSILGGLIVRLGDRLLDGSTRSRLLALRRRLATG
ncbi:MAG: ATP synthase F1 subunit delta [Chloroflexi bacterium]|nr:ATP synthase F1 subunit delta [Chloroflexota bacterium]